MSRLARRGTVLHNVGGGNEAFLVCGHTPFGVVALRLTMRAVDRLDGTRCKLPVLSLRQAETNLESAKDFCRYLVVRDRALGVVRAVLHPDIARRRVQLQRRERGPLEA